MCFVLEEEQPFFDFSVNININFNCASINFFTLIKTVKLAVCFKIFCSDCADIHKIDGLCSADCLAGFDVSVISRLQKLVLKLNAVNRCEECCMTAMVRPVCVNHSDFCDCWVALFANEVLLAELYVINIHSKAHIINHFLKSCNVQINKPIKSCNSFGDFINCLQCFGHFKRCFS